MPHVKRLNFMQDEYDFSKGKRGAIIPNKGKSRITIYIDNNVLDSFRDRAEQAGTGYQTLINEALKNQLSQDKPLTELTLRQILKEEFPKVA